MTHRQLFGIVLIMIAAGGLAFRAVRLGVRPMHADEAVQAARFRDLWHQGRFEYDPNEFHGPTLVYATLPAAWIDDARSFAETTESTYRAVPVVLGAAMVLLVWLLADGLGRPAALVAALLMAVSPAMVFYSRYYIHETLLVCFTLAAVGTGWRYWKTGRPAWCLACGASVGLMQATKETAVLVYFSAAAGLAMTWAYSKWLGDDARQGKPRRLMWHLAAGLAAALVVAAALYSSFFTNPRGLLDAVRTYLPWLARAGGGSPHIHPWYDYLHRLAFWRMGRGPWWSEGLILALAAAGFVAALLPKRMLPPAMPGGLVRWLAFFTLTLTTVYSAIPYKTPWCLLGMLQGMILLAGIGTIVLIRLLPRRVPKAIAILLLLAALGHLAWQAYRASCVQPADPGNPYAYVQTLPNAVRLAETVEQIAAAGPQGNAMPLQVVWHDAYYWPLPWYFRRFDRLELWTAVPPDPTAEVVVASALRNPELTERLDATHVMADIYGIRPQVLAVLWVRKDLWQSYLKDQGRL